MIAIPKTFEKLLNLEPDYREELPSGLVYIEITESPAITIFIKGLSHADQN